MPTAGNAGCRAAYSARARMKMVVAMPADALPPHRQNAWPMGRYVFGRGPYIRYGKSLKKRAEAWLV